MPCFIGCFAIGFPRIAMLLVVIFSDYIGNAFESNLWPFLGFFFMPLTTLAYANAMHMGGGSVHGIGLVILVLAVLLDLGLMGTGANTGGRQTVVYVQKGRPPRKKV